MPRSITAKASNPARGTSANFRMTPITSPCATAIPMTPCATERMVAPASFRKSSLLSATTRERKVLEAATKRGRRPDDDPEADDRKNDSSQFRPIAEHAGKPVEDGIERDRQHHAPGEDRHERADHDE